MYDNNYKYTFDYFRNQNVIEQTNASKWLNNTKGAPCHNTSSNTKQQEEIKYAVTGE
jgi:hypothetical protein